MQKYCFKKTEEFIKQCSNNNIISKNKKFYDAPKTSEESVSENLEQKLYQ